MPKKALSTRALTGHRTSVYIRRRCVYCGDEWVFSRVLDEIEAKAVINETFGVDRQWQSPFRKREGHSNEPFAFDCPDCFDYMKAHDGEIPERAASVRTRAALWV